VKDWEQFEKRIITESALSRVTCVACGQTVRKIGPNKMIAVKGNVDFILGLDGNFIMTDAKVTQDHVWNLKENILHPGKVHQWAQLKAAEALHNRSGYLMWFKTLGKIVWASTYGIERIIEDGGLSIHPESPWMNSQPDDLQINFRELIYGRPKKETELLKTSGERSNPSSKDPNIHRPKD
jgi:hypothetical protein